MKVFVALFFVWGIIGLVACFLTMNPVGMVGYASAITGLLLWIGGLLLFGLGGLLLKQLQEPA